MKTTTGHSPVHLSSTRHPLSFLFLSKDRFDEGSVSFDEYGKGGIYQEASVLSDSAVVDDVAESDGNRSVSVDDVDDDEVEVGNQSKPKVFEFSGSRSTVAPLILRLQELATSSHQMLREN
jgi:hypothetical protein